MWCYAAAACVLGLAWSAHDELRGGGAGRRAGPGASGSADGAIGGTASAWPTTGELRSPAGAVGDSAERPGSAAGPPRLHLSLKPVGLIGSAAASNVGHDTPIARAVRMIDRCQDRYDEIQDYVCTFSKRERINGRLTPLHVMTMKVRANPRSIYLKFQQPAAGREAIFIDGRHGGKVLAHDVGLNKLLAGTLRLDPTGSRAMEECRHPITEAGIGPLLDTLENRWAAELDPSESLVTFRHDRRPDGRAGTLIETTHPSRQPGFLFYRVRVFVDQGLGLPTHFEAYDWPEKPEMDPEIVEEYSYSNLRINVGLSDRDFDVSNAEYSFGRF